MRNRLPVLAMFLILGTAGWASAVDGPWAPPGPVRGVERTLDQSIGEVQPGLVETHPGDAGRLVSDTRLGSTRNKTELRERASAMLQYRVLRIDTEALLDRKDRRRIEEMSGMLRYRYLRIDATQKLIDREHVAQNLLYRYLPIEQATP